MDLDYLQSGDYAKTGKKTESKREKRLERNRESARKCRRKRKAYVGDLEGKCHALEDENTILQLENERLRTLVQQLQNGTVDSEPSCKRKKSEFGVQMANDLSESAVEFSAGHLDHLAAIDGACREDYHSRGELSEDTVIGTLSASSSHNTSGETEVAAQRPEECATQKLDCDLSSLLPLVGALKGEEQDVPIKVEALTDQSPSASDNVRSVPNLEDGGFMAGLAAGNETCSGSFANDVLVDPLSLDDFLSL